MPDLNLHTIITYSDIFEEKIDVQSLCAKLPLEASIRYIASEMRSVVICVNDLQTQKVAIEKLAKTLPPVCVQKLNKLCASNKAILLISESSFISYRYLLRYGDANSTQSKLTDNQIVDVYKLILLCNNDITFKQTNNVDLTKAPSNSNEIRNILLRQDLSLVEFRTIKSFETQIYKATRFFVFLEQNEEWGKYLSDFYEKYHVSHWTEYIEMIFTLVHNNLMDNNEPWVIKACDPRIVAYLEDACIDISMAQSSSELADEQNWLNYFRNKFLLKSNDGFILLNLNLLIDKIYQGLFFDYKNVMVAKGCTNTKTIHDKKGQIFSEPYLLYPLLYAIGSNSYDKVLSENRLIALGKEKKSLPDFYMRKGSIALLFEFKDVTLGNSSKYSDDTDEIIRNINKRLCIQKEKENGETSQREGVAQLLHSIDRIYNQGLLAEIDPNYNCAETIFPIVITTDRSFSAAGVNLLITEGFSNIYNKSSIKNLQKFIIKPVIVEYDTLLSCLSELRNHHADLCSLLWEYVSSASPYYSFAAFVEDKFSQQADGNRNENTMALAGEYASCAYARQMLVNYATMMPKLCDVDGEKFFIVSCLKSNHQYENIAKYIHSWHNSISLSDECFVCIGDRSFAYGLLNENNGDPNINCLVFDYNTSINELNGILAKTLNQITEITYCFDELKWYYDQDVYSRLSLLNYYLKKFGGNELPINGINASSVV